MDTTQDTPHTEPTTPSLHTVFGVASAALYLLTFFIFMLERNPAVWGSSLVLSLLATASSIGVRPHRCGVAGGIGGGLMALAAVAAALGSAPWAWGLLAGTGGVFALAWAEYRCPKKHSHLAIRGHTLPPHPLHSIHLPHGLHLRRA